MTVLKTGNHIVSDDGLAQPADLYAPVAFLDGDGRNALYTMHQVSRAVLDERERCAKVVQRLMDHYQYLRGLVPGDQCLEAIRIQGRANPDGQPLNDDEILRLWDEQYATYFGQRGKAIAFARAVLSAAGRGNAAGENPANLPQNPARTEGG